MKLDIRTPDDLHLHVREGTRMKKVIPHSARQCARALIMPNTVQGITSAFSLVRYRREIKRTRTPLEPLMTIKVTPKTTPSIIHKAKEVGAVAGKLYPNNVTTHSQGGVSNFRALFNTFGAMEEAGMVLCLHGEHPDPAVMCPDAEEAFLPILCDIVSHFPRLKVVLEHVSTEAGITAVERLPDTVAATITAHHMVLTINDVIGDGLRPHNYCKPVAKWPEDRKAIVRAAISGNPKFFLGSDSAPHAKEDKECAKGCAGVYTAPILLPLLAQNFAACDALGMLDDFTSRFGAEFYNLPLNSGRIRLVRRRWTVPAAYDGIVPFLAGQRLDWQIE